MVDTHTVKLNLIGGGSALLAALGMRARHTISPTAPEEVRRGLRQQSVEAGPYQFVEWVPNDHITLKRFPDYWDKNAAYLDEVTFRRCRTRPSACRTCGAASSTTSSCWASRTSRRCEAAATCSSSDLAGRPLHLQQQQAALRQQAATPGAPARNRPPGDPPNDLLRDRRDRVRRSRRPELGVRSGLEADRRAGPRQGPCQAEGGRPRTGSRSS